jgi:MerR family transcriptional regulator, light-induced transcriptional regulator
MHCLKTTEAAALLNITPSTLRAWEQRFGFPVPQRSPGGHRAYAHAEVAALQAALRTGISIGSAVADARAKMAADSGSLVRALSAYDRDLADRAIETALGLRSVERAVEELLLPSLEEIVRSHGAESAVWAFAARWAADWLRRAKRLASPSVSHVAVVLADGSRGELDIDALYIRALEVLCIRAGLKVLRLSTQAVIGVGDAVSVYRPNLGVLAGGHADDDTVARWMRHIGRAVGPIPVGLYRQANTASGGAVLPPTPGQAQIRLMEMADAAPQPQSSSWRGNDRLRLRATTAPGSQSGAPWAAASNW